MNINQFLEQLDKVKMTGSGKWVACCPVHKDRTPSLAIRLVDGDSILFHCFGCGANGIEICQALNINPSELFPSKPHNRERKPFPADQILAALLSEATIVEIAAHDIAAGETLTSTEFARVKTARDRISLALDYAKT